MRRPQGSVALNNESDVACKLKYGRSSRSVRGPHLTAGTITRQRRSPLLCVLRASTQSQPHIQRPSGLTQGLASHSTKHGSKELDPYEEFCVVFIKMVDAVIILYIFLEKVYD